MARADDRAYRQILINLLSNAVKYTPRGGRIELDCVMKDGLVGVIVADDGIGIAPEDVARLGRPFERVGDARTRRHPGTGLGLALSRGLAEMMGGRLDIESEIGRGTRATIWLPAVKSPSPD
ncbi:MAG: hypothetical protein FJX47_18615 [Alphaproteobacteria bacterium]|nr:hypothetical protein [Alphaproteobacteria bacterium]